MSENITKNVTCWESSLISFEKYGRHPLFAYLYTSFAYFVEVI